MKTDSFPAENLNSVQRFEHRSARKAYFLKPIKNRTRIEQRFRKLTYIENGLLIPMLLLTADYALRTAQLT
ncbi:hypothetical protein I7I53_01980 [Histoplasma capsulatum var. duboisii H88]|uniref:Uncharacterized protein n=1 Tax=Ajellomyces capsulatus (strain H88) TaxID=544711 RepID=A0A8A1LR26_AJEC8|nr:hypothetical protein I7I53_01980 [Histoplasma capsulatum var. duboisii H88]